MSLRITVSLLVVSFILLGTAYGKTPKTVTDKSADFSRYRTYAWSPGAPAPNPIMDSLIIATVDHELQQAGLDRVDPAAADLLVRYDVGASIQSASAVTDPTYTASGGAAPLTTSPAWTVGGATQSLARGNLSIRVMDKAKERVVWSSIAEENLDDAMSRRARQVDKLVVRMFKQFPRAKK